MDEVVEVTIDVRVYPVGKYAPSGKSQVKIALTRDQIGLYSGKNVVKSAIMCALINLEAQENPEPEENEDDDS